MDYIHNPYETQVDVTLIRRKEHEQFTVEGHGPHNRGLPGIGAVYANRLAKRGFDLILVARSVVPLKALAASLSSASGRHITSIVADLNNETDLAKVEAKLKDDPSITMLVNNAGSASLAPLLEAEIRKMQDMIALNVTALTRLSYAAAPAFVKQ
jgi:uncharacterized protein